MVLEPGGDYLELVGETAQVDVDEPVIFLAVRSPLLPAEPEIQR